MPTNYQLIAEENLRKYGTEIDRIGAMLLANRYADRTHFVYELLQNAEDALSWHAPAYTPTRTVTFSLAKSHLHVLHHGLPFQEKHVRGICGIGESTKEELTAIGRFGIGFKSVYAFTKRPEVHSDDEHFAIESFVRPCATKPIDTSAGQTVFHIPFHDEKAFPDILQRLRTLGHRTLLFLRQIETIEWESADGTGGTYLRETKHINPALRKVTLIGQSHGTSEVDQETWLVFSREVSNFEGQKVAAHVEVAYSLDADSATPTIRPISDSSLVVFFPTEKETYFGCLVQGPYRTTPSRDNVPKEDMWNRHLVAETAVLVQESLRTLREMGLLTVSALQAMPLDSTKFLSSPAGPGAGAMFEPVFTAVKTALKSEELIPRHPNGHAPGQHARLGRTDALRRLLSPEQLAQLYGESTPLYWLNEDITRDRTPQLRAYLLNQLNIPEVDPEDLLNNFSLEFIQPQEDEWVSRFYTFLLDTPALWRSGGFRHQPIIRLEDGRHVSPFDAQGLARAFLPSTSRSGFPTVKRTVCQDPTALKFLQQLGLTEPDPVDDVVVNVLPEFADPSGLTEEAYAACITSILAGYQTDSASRREKLLAKLGETSFVRCRNAITDAVSYQPPAAVYLPTEKLLVLFRGTAGVWFVDDRCAVLRGDLPRKLLEASGVRDYLRRIPCDCHLDFNAKRGIRRANGNEQYRGESAEDFDVVGLQEAVSRIAALPTAEVLALSVNLWSVLADALREGREQYFHGTYSWRYMQRHWSALFPAKFVAAIKSTTWVPSPNGQLVKPTDICFSDVPQPIRDAPNPVLQNLLAFKPEVIQQLALQAGIDPSTLDLLKKHCLDKNSLLKILQDAGLEDTGETAAAAILGPGAPPPMPPPTISPPPGTTPTTGPHPGGTGGGGNKPPDPPGGGGPAKHPDTNPQAGRFFSYVYVLPEQTGGGGDGKGEHPSEKHKREKLSREGVDHVLKWEADAGCRFPTEMPHTHEGYDVESRDATGAIARYIEVKSIKTALGERGVTLSHAQFQAAQRLRKAFWLYVVEGAQTAAPRLLRIQDPASRIDSFAFDHGWREIAEPDPQPPTDPQPEPSNGE